MKYTLEVMWNRSYQFSSIDEAFVSVRDAINYESRLNSPEGDRIKKFRVIDSDGEQVHPKLYKSTLEEKKIYTCSFCDKQELGKDPSILINPIKSFNDKLRVSLMPEGWEWDIVPVKFTDLWSCGCTKINKTNHKHS